MDITGQWYNYDSYILELTAIYHDCSVHSGQMVDYTVYTTGGAFDLSIKHSTNVVTMKMEVIAVIQHLVQCTATLCTYTYCIPLGTVPFTKARALVQQYFQFHFRSRVMATITDFQELIMMLR